MSNTVCSMYQSYVHMYVLHNTQCEKYKNYSHFFVKAMVLLKKLISQRIFCKILVRWERKFLVFPHYSVQYGKTQKYFVKSTLSLLKALFSRFFFFFLTKKCEREHRQCGNYGKFRESNGCTKHSVEKYTKMRSR